MKKTCTNCKDNKLLTDFYKRSMVPDGRCSECKECSKRRNKNVHRNYYSKNKEKLLVDHREYGKIYRQSEAYKKKKRDRNKERLRTDVIFKLSHNLRRRMRSAIKRNQKIGSAVSDLGCTIQFFKNYIESKFQNDMSWDNYGRWHLDHIQPLASFDLSNRDQFLKAANYTNYQPLWAEDNLRKSSTYSTSSISG